MKLRRVVTALILNGLIATPAAAHEAADKASVAASVDASTRFIYNVYYDYLRDVNDEALAVTPTLAAHTKPGSFQLIGDASGYYEKYATNSIQDHFDFAGNVAAIINNQDSPHFKLGGKYKSFSDPSPTETFGRIQRNQTEGSATLGYKTMKGSSVDITVRVGMETFTIPTVSTQYLNNNWVEGAAEYKNAFLPETSWFVRGSGGFRQWPASASPVDPNDTNTYLTSDPALAVKSNSMFGLVETGFVGRLTDKSSVDSAVGWMIRSYQDQSAFGGPVTGIYGFNAPVFYAHFTEQITRRDQFLVGYDYKVNDSYFTDYVLNQEIYTGVARVIGDQVLILMRVGYQYNSYSLPNRREDVRAIGSLVARYSISPTVKLTADVKVDLLSSDAYDNTTSPGQAFIPDRPASYRAGSLGFGVVANF